MRSTRGTKNANELRAALEATNAEFSRDATGRYGVWCHFVKLSAMSVSLDNAVSVSEEPRRRRVERAFMHLNRTLSLDESARAVGRRDVRGCMREARRGSPPLHTAYTDSRRRPTPARRT